VERERAGRSRNGLKWSIKICSKLIRHQIELRYFPVSQFQYWNLNAEVNPTSGGADVNTCGRYDVICSPGQRRATTGPTSDYIVGPTSWSDVSAARGRSLPYNIALAPFSGGVVVTLGSIGVTHCFSMSPRARHASSRISCSGTLDTAPPTLGAVECSGNRSGRKVAHT